MKSLFPTITPTGKPLKTKRCPFVRTGDGVFTCPVCGAVVQSSADRYVRECGIGSSASDTPAPLPKPGPSARPIGHGPGTELKKILAGLGFSACGNCNDYANRMDAWGVAGCRDRRAEIIEHLRKKRKEASFLEKLAAAGKSLWTVNPLDPIGSIVDESIRRA